MNRILSIIMALVCCTLASCDKEEWSNNNSEMVNVFYVGFENWGKTTAEFNKNAVVYSVKSGDTAKIPIQFWSEQYRTWNVETFFYTAGTLVNGTDYQIVDDKGNVVTPVSPGKYSMIWNNAVKGVKNVYVKILKSNANKTFLLQTFDPAASTPISPQDVATTIHNKTNDYEVRAFSTNYKVTIKVTN